MHGDRKLSKAEMAELLARLRNPQVRVGEQRSAKRHHCRWSAVVHQEPRDVPCVVENISHSGCRVRTVGAMLSAGEPVVVHIPPQKMVLDGVVAWSRSGEAGIHFNFGRQSFNIHL
jgi:hypothetical protein